MRKFFVMWISKRKEDENKHQKCIHIIFIDYHSCSLHGITAVSWVFRGVFSVFLSFFFVFNLLLFAVKKKKNRRYAPRKITPNYFFYIKHVLILVLDWSITKQRRKTSDIEIYRKQAVSQNIFFSNPYIFVPEGFQLNWNVSAQHCTTMCS